MVAKKGKDLVLKLDADGVGAFVNGGGAAHAAAGVQLARRST
jgi:hypothetical protein